MSFVTEAKVKSVFNELFECDCVKEVNMVPMEKDGKTYQMCFVHFNDVQVDPEIGGGKWSKLVPNDKSSFFKLRPDHKVNPHTGEPYFWKVFLNKKSKPEIIE
jgi:hypothetical protein